MKKNIIIGVLMVITLFSVVWGLTRQIEATRQEQIAIKCQQQAHEQMVLAEKLRAKAEAISMKLRDSAQTSNSGSEKAKN